MLLCIEMAIFSILHIFAFPWRSTYSLSNSDAVTAPGMGYSGRPRYVGGFLGIRAYIDAFNVWDVVKGASRGFRWLFVGRRHRRQDPSYATNPFSDPPSYPGGGADGAHQGTKLQPINTATSPYSKENRYPTAGRTPDFGASTVDLGTLQPDTAYKPEHAYPVSPFESPYDTRGPPSAISSRGHSPNPPSAMGRRGGQMGEERRWYNHGGHGYEEDQAGLLSGAPAANRRPSDHQYGPSQHPALRK